MEILDTMESVIAEPRKELSKYAPKIEILHINPDKIKDVIGKGGEMITKIICEASNVAAVTDINAVKVDLEDDGKELITLGYKGEKIGEILEYLRKAVINDPAKNNIDDLKNLIP